MKTATFEQYLQSTHYYRVLINKQRRLLGLEPYRVERQHGIKYKQRKDSGSIKPHRWLVGPDPVLHRKYEVWQLHKAQAIFRGEAYDLSFEDFCSIWQQDWHLRGRGSMNMTMVRIDPTCPWSRYNVEIMLRRDFLKINKQLRV